MSDGKAGGIDPPQEKTQGNTVRESCVLSGQIADFWEMIRPFTFANMPQLFQNVQPVEGKLGEVGSICVMNYVHNEPEKVRVTQIDNAEHLVRYDVVGVDNQVTCKRSVQCLQGSDRAQVFAEFISEFSRTIPIKEFIDEQQRKRLLFKVLRNVYVTGDDTAPWLCDCGHTNLNHIRECQKCHRKNFKNVKWTTIQPHIASIPHGQRYESWTFELAGQKWKLLVLPHGHPEKNFQYLAMYLQIHEFSDGQQFPCQFYFRVVHPSEAHSSPGLPGEMSVTSDAPWTFTNKPDAFDRGKSDVLELNRLGQYTSRDGFLMIQVGIGPKLSQRN